MGYPKLVLAPLSPEAQKLYDAICARGYAPHGKGPADLRDAAHEAHHALSVGLRKPWDRERIHQAILRRAKRDAGVLIRSTELLVRYELHARAVEWTICERYGIEYELERWADITWWETAKNMNIHLPPLDQIAEAIKSVKGSRRIECFANDVARLATAKQRRAA